MKLMALAAVAGALAQPATARPDRPLSCSVVEAAFEARDRQIVRIATNAIIEAMRSEDRRYIAVGEPSALAHMDDDGLLRLAAQVAVECSERTRQNVKSAAHVIYQDLRDALFKRDVSFEAEGPAAEPRPQRG